MGEKERASKPAQLSEANPVKPKYALQTPYAVSYDDDENTIGAAKRRSSISHLKRQHEVRVHVRQQTESLSGPTPTQQPVFEGTTPDRDVVTVPTQADSAPQSSSASPTATEVNARKGWRQSAGFLKNLPAVNVTSILAHPHSLPEEPLVRPKKAVASNLHRPPKVVLTQPTASKPPPAVRLPIFTYSD